MKLSKEHDAPTGQRVDRSAHLPLYDVSDFVGWIAPRTHREVEVDAFHLSTLHPIGPQNFYFPIHKFPVRFVKDFPSE